MKSIYTCGPIYLREGASVSPRHISPPYWALIPARKKSVRVSKIILLFPSYNYLENCLRAQILNL